MLKDLGLPRAALCAQKTFEKMRKCTGLLIGRQVTVIEKQIENEATQLQSQEMQTPPPPDPKAQEWAARNKWFGDDVAMTSSAFAFHRQLVEEQGIDPATDKYYEELDGRIKDAFPHKFEQANKPVQAVAGGSVGATTVNKSKKIKLTSSQVAIAKKLGVPLAEYAKHVQQ